MPEPQDAALDPVVFGRMLAQLGHAAPSKDPYTPPTQSAQPPLAPLADIHARQTYETVGPPDPPPPPPSPWTKAETIGASRVGERYATPSFNEIMAMDSPLKGITEHLFGAGRPRSVVAADPQGIEAWMKGAGAPPVMMAGETEEVGNLARSLLPEAEASGVRVYHGSPHSFAPEPGAPYGRFRADKIGTGQGAASYGHGHYLAEAEPVAVDYRNMLSRNASGEWTYGGQPVPDAAQHAPGQLTQALHLAGHPLPGESMETFLRRRIPDMEARAEYNEKAYGERSPWRGHADTLRSLDAAQLAYRPAGHMYEARIQGDPTHFLDWDKSLASQSAPVQEAIARLGAQPEPMERIWTPHQVTEADIRHLRVGPNMQPGDWTAVQQDRAGTIQYHTGQTYHSEAQAAAHAETRNAASRGLQKFDTGSGLYRNLESAMGEVDASARLRDAGLPGVRYLDQHSRNASYNPLIQDMIGKYGSREAALKVAEHHYQNASLGSLRYWQDAVDALSPPETRNFVVFPGNERLIEILRKYGLVPPLAAGLLGRGRSSDDEQPPGPPPVMAPSH